MKENIALAGFRCTGKSTVAHLVAERLDMSRVSVDETIVQRAGKPIADIFAEDGEPEFRRLEAEVVTDLCRGTRTVIDTGGGEGDALLITKDVL